MDQRTDNERRLDTAPGRATRSAIGEVRRPQSWLDRMRARRRMILTIMALIIVGIVAVVAYWLSTRDYQSTDDAFIDARNVSVSPQVGRRDHRGAGHRQPARSGRRLLVQIDPRDYQAAVDQAEAQVAQANATIANLDAQIEAQQARIDQAGKTGGADPGGAHLRPAGERAPGPGQARRRHLSRRRSRPLRLDQAQATVASAAGERLSPRKSSPGAAGAARRAREAQLEQSKPRSSTPRTIWGAPTDRARGRARSTNDRGAVGALRRSRARS